MFVKKGKICIYMSTLKGSYQGHRFHGAPERFEVVAEFINRRFGRSIKYIADVAGGRGMLTRILNKKYNYQAEVVDPRGWALVGVPSRKETFTPEMASYYDLIIGIHPDEATRPVVESALIKPVIVIPCCNFWDQNQTLGRDALIAEISKYYDKNRIRYEKVIFGFKSSKNVGLVSFPPMVCD
jgi:hypothetical protein